MNVKQIKSNFVGVNRLFVLVYTIEANNAKRFNARKYHLPKGIIKYYVIINGKSCYDQAIGSDIKRYKETSKLATGQGEDGIPGCLLDYEYIKSHYRLIAVDFDRQLDSDPKVIQQIELVGQLKKLDGVGNTTDPGNICFNLCLS